jgi:hypothetical protein
MQALPALFAGYAVGPLEGGRAYTPILPAFIPGFQTLSAQTEQCTLHIQGYLAEAKQTLASIPGVGPSQAIEGS